MRRFMGVLLALSMLVIAGCGGEAKKEEPKPQQSQQTQQPAAKKDVPGVTDTEIVIGTWMPVTGPAAAWAVIGKTYSAYWDMVNEKGGVNGRKVRIIMEDDSYSPAKTVPLVKKMVEQDKVFAFVGGLGTNGGSAVMQYIIDNKVPHLAPSTGSSKWSQPPAPGYYAWQLSYKTEAGVLVKYGIETLKKKKFAIFYQNDDYGKEGLEEAKAQLKKRGGELVEEVAYNTTDSDLSAHALRLKQSGAEAVLTWPTVKAMSTMLKETAKIGYKPTWLSSATGADASLIKLAPQESQGVYFVGYLPDPSDPANANIPVVKEWKENLPKYGKDLPMSFFTMYGWAQSRLLHEALNRAGKDLSRESFIAALESLKDWKDLATVTYTATDRRGIAEGWMVQIKGENIAKVSDVIKVD